MLETSCQCCVRLDRGAKQLWRSKRPWKCIGERAVLGCCCPSEGERSAKATQKGTERCCHPGKVQSYLPAGGTEQVQEMK